MMDILDNSNTAGALVWNMLVLFGPLFFIGWLENRLAHRLDKKNKVNH